MKILIKIFFILCIICFSASPVYDGYRFMPESLSKEYKAEMEKIIDEEYQKVIQNIDDAVQDIIRLHEKIMKNDHTFDEYIDIGLIYEIVLPAADLDLYSKMVQVTQEKYLRIKYDILGSSTSLLAAEYLAPYMDNNDVDTRKLLKIGRYESKQLKFAKKYIQEVDRFVRGD